jgi:hypothetical protein
VLLIVVIGLKSADTSLSIVEIVTCRISPLWIVMGGIVLEESNELLVISLK